MTIRRNRFAWIPADAIQAGTTESLRIERNRFHHVTPYLRASEHADPIQLHGTARNVIVRSNYFHDQPRGLIAKRAAFHNLVIENNLMVRLSNVALNIYDAPGVRIVNNTIWNTGLGLRLNDLPQVDAKMKRAVLVNTIIDTQRKPLVLTKWLWLDRTASR